MGDLSDIIFAVLSRCLSVGGDVSIPIEMTTPGGITYRCTLKWNFQRSSNTMKVNTLPAILVPLVALASCAYTKPEPLDIKSAIKKSETREVQTALADLYERTATQMLAKIEEHKALLSQYEGKSYLYENRSRETIELSQKLIEVYGRAAEENRKMARIHRDVAAQLPCHTIGVPGHGNLVPCSWPAAVTDTIRAVTTYPLRETGTAR
jgi:hypothetical protein